jgi:Na+/melibiose symporter-like transporter
MAVMSALFFFYVDFYFCGEMTAGKVNNAVGFVGAAIMFGMQIVALPFYLAMIKKTGKIVAYVSGAAIWIAGALCLFILPANSNPVTLYILAAIIGFGISGPGLVPHALLPDVIDVGQLQFGARSAGMFSGLANMVVQISQAIGVSAAMTIIGAAGFIEQDIREGAAKVTSQSVRAQSAIVAIMAVTPLIFMSAGIICCARYRLNKIRHARVLEVLDSGDDDKRAAVLRSL